MHIFSLFRLIILQVTYNQFGEITLSLDGNVV